MTRPVLHPLENQPLLTALPDLLVDPVVRAALAEDLGRAGDITAAACVPAGQRLKARFAARTAGRIAGLDCARLAIAAMDPTARFEVKIADGEDAPAGGVLAEVEADARALLSAERVALNLLGRLSGVASLTAQYVQAVAGTGANITCTRKTTPGLRALEKYAIRCGGGINHRFGLDDAILIKDNHIAACGGVGKALQRARAAAGHLVKIEIEVDTLAQLDEALAAQESGHGPDVVLLDNFPLDDMRLAVIRAKRKVVLEASGGVTLETVRAIAETGVDVISSGALTHSAPVLDIGLDV
jgi:nicotinate-nucleotide pyrophosphorylase (carboxylating)